MSALSKWVCSGGSDTSNDICTPKYPDGYIVGNELCDDNNTNDNDGCYSPGLISQGYNCFGEPSICLDICSNAKLGSSEECDDGNSIDLDGCS